MRRVCVRALEAAILLAAIVVLVVSLPAKGLRWPRSGDLRVAIESAKRTVYPALVYVRPTGEQAGTGVIISAGGSVVTQEELVAGASDINCVLYDRRQVSARLVGSDAATGLALLQLELTEDAPPLPYAELGDSSKLQEGEFVLALGCPYAFNRSISLGIVSNTMCYLGHQTPYSYHNWIQTDAAIHPGNAGGALVDTEAKVVGINFLLPSLAQMGGLAIPSNIVKDIARRLTEEGEVRRAWLGLKLEALRDFDRNTFTEAEGGVLVLEVEENSPAAAAGIEAGDILLAVNDQSLDGTFVEELPGVRRRLAYLPVGEEATLRVQREGERLELVVTPSLKPK